MGRERPAKDMSTDTIRRFAEGLIVAAEQIKNIATELDAHDIKTMSVGFIGTIVGSVEGIAKWVGSLEATKTQLLLDKSLDHDRSEIAEAVETVRKARRKAKPDSGQK